MTAPLKCPKCPGTMRTYDRGGVHLEQCDSCRGVFLDVGELEAIEQAVMQYSAPPPMPGYAPPPQQAYAQPGWGHGHRPAQRHRSFARMLFSS